MDHGTKTQSSKQVNWLDLPQELVYYITDKLSAFKDYIYFGIVCKLWQSFYLKGVKRHLLRRQRQFPLLLLPPEINQHGSKRSLFDIANKRICNMQVRLPHRRTCIGSCNGWLIIICDNYNAFLLNPFVSYPHNQIQLPSLRSCRHQEYNVKEDLHRVFLSDNPIVNSKNLLVVAIYGISSNTFFCKPGDKLWTRLDTAMECGLCYGDRFYFTNRLGALFTWDPNEPNPQTKSPVLSQILSKKDTEEVDGKNSSKYLVEVSKDLLLVRRFFDIPDTEHFTFQTIGFHVLKVNLDERTVTEVRSLGGYAIFIGLNSPFSVLASEFQGCKPNCIYFTDDYLESFFNEEEMGPYAAGLQDIGVFSLDDGSIEPCYPVDFHRIDPAPLWVEPTLKPLYN